MPNSFPSPQNSSMITFFLLFLWRESDQNILEALPLPNRLKKFIDKEKSLHEFMDLSTTILRERETRGLDVFWGHQPTRSSLWTKIIFPVIAWLKLRRGRYLEPAMIIHGTVATVSPSISIFKMGGSYFENFLFFYKNKLLMIKSLVPVHLHQY
jgi:hypothetical protein